MDTKVQQKTEKPNFDISKYLPFGAQAELANKHKTSRAYVNAVVRGYRHNNEIYAEALEMAETEKYRREQYNKLQERAAQLAE